MFRDVRIAVSKQRNKRRRHILGMCKQELAAKQKRSFFGNWKWNRKYEYNIV